MKAGWGAVTRDLVETADRFAAHVGKTRVEVVLLEPGFQALWRYRVASWFWANGFRLFGCLFAGFTRRATGIDIHPAARIGRHCLILGSGVAIGQTAVLGDGCLIEPGVLLTSGGLAVARDNVVSFDDLPPGLTPQRVHPTVGKRAVLEAGCLLVGDVFLGDDVRVLAGAVVTRDVPDRGVAVGSPGRVLAREQARPDPDARAAQALAARLYKLEEQLQVVAFEVQRGKGGLADQWRTRNPQDYGPIPAVETLIDGAGI